MINGSEESCTKDWEAATNPVFVGVVCAVMISTFVTILININFTKKFLMKKILFGLLMFFNLMFTVITFATCVFQLTYLLIYNHKCEILFRASDCAVSFVPSLLALVGLVATQAAIGIERGISTFHAPTYEEHGMCAGIFLAMAAIAFALGGTAFGLSSANYSDVLVTCASVPMSAAITTNLLYFVMLFLDITTFSFSVFLYKYNKKQLLTGKYSIRRRYQLNENLRAIRLFLPLDVIHTALYTFYILGTVILRVTYVYIPRAYVPAIGGVLYVVPYYSLAQVLILRHVTNKEEDRREKMKRERLSRNIEEEGRNYFQDLQKSWQ